MHESHNPYAAPAALVASPPELPGEIAKADRGVRLGAYLVDSILYSLCFGPGYFQLILVGEDVPVHYGPLGTTISIAGLVVGLALFACNLWLLNEYGQTVAKRWLGIRIVRTDGTRAGLARLFWLRSFVPSIIGVIPCLGGIFSLVDALMIFSDDKRCLHDRMADTIVVVA